MGSGASKAQTECLSCRDTSSILLAHLDLRSILAACSTCKAGAGLKESITRVEDVLTRSGMISVLALRSLAHLDLTRSRHAGLKIAPGLADVLRGNTIKTLLLQGQSICPEGATVLAGALRGNASLTEVCILPLHSPLPLHRPSYRLSTFLAVGSR